MRPILLSCLAAMLLLGCASLAPSTVGRLASLDPLTTDPSGIELLVILPKGLAATPGSAKLEFGAQRASEVRKGTFQLEDRPVGRDILVPSGATARRYGVSAADAARLRALQAEIAIWKQEGKAEGMLGLGIGGCAVDGGPAKDATGSVLIRFAADEPFLPLVDDAMLVDLLGRETLAAIQPCNGAE